MTSLIAEVTAALACARPKGTYQLHCLACAASVSKVGIENKEFDNE
jgi:hypothetical protein